MQSERPNIDNDVSKYEKKSKKKVGKEVSSQVAKMK